MKPIQEASYIMKYLRALLWSNFICESSVQAEEPGGSIGEALR